MINLPCPYCNKGSFSYSSILLHVNRCKFNDNSISYADIRLKYFDEQLLAEIAQKYINGYSLNELCHQYQIKRGIIELYFKTKSIHIRNVKESTNCTRCIDVRKQSCEQHYGKGITNPSQANEVKQQKANTFMKHYGVDNIRKLPQYYEYVNDICLKRYGKKRISGWTGKTFEERKDIERRRQETRVKNGLYDSMLEERIDEIMTKHNIRHQRCFWAYHHPYDFIFGDHILLEINGDYWHANPKIYKASDIMINGKTAQEIWNYDAQFRDCLIGSQFKIVYLWEYDIIQMSDDEIANWLLEQINENKKNN